MASFDCSSPGDVEVKLDGSAVEVPPERRTFSAIRSWLESLALQQQRILCSLSVDGEPVNLTQPRLSSKPFARIEGETMSLNEVPAQLIKAALQQTANARSRVRTAVALVLINDPRWARELWWNLATALKEPLLTLSLLPDSTWGPAPDGASLMQLRKWQLQQLGSVIQDVDDACRTDDTILLAEVLENRALKWLDGLHDSLSLWHDSIHSDSGAAACPGA